MNIKDRLDAIENDGELFKQSIKEEEKDIDWKWKKGMREFIKKYNETYGYS